MLSIYLKALTRIVFLIAQFTRIDLSNTKTIDLQGIKIKY